jgi:hypothetical protein
VSDALILPRGARFAERFEIVRELAPVLCGQDYAARRDGDGAAGRLTVLAPAMADSEPGRANFRERMRLAQRVKDGGIVPVIDAGIDEATGAPWAYAPWVEGSPLADVIRARGPLPRDTVRALLEPLVEALGSAHADGVVHGAISPATLLLEPAAAGPGQLRLLRVGVEGVVRKAMPEALLASVQDLAWLSPEWARGRPDLTSPATDVHALALIAFYLFSGRPILDAPEDTSPGGMLVLLCNPLPRPSDRWTPTPDDERSDRGLPPGFDDWFLRCTDGDPKRRPADVREAWRSLADPTSGRKPSPPPRAPASPPPFTSEDVPPDEWSAIVAEALPAPVEQWSDDEGGAHVAGGGVEVVLFPARSLVRAAGIDWYVRSILPRRSLETVLERIARVAALLRDAPRLGERIFITRWLLLRRFKEVLRELDVPPPPPADPSPYGPELPPIGALCATLDGEDLDAMVADEAWVTSHRIGVVGSTFARIPYAHLPADRETFAALCAILREIAPSIRDRPLWICDYCGRAGPPVEMNNRTTCHRCAETHLGVIY